MMTSTPLRAWLSAWRAVPHSASTFVPAAWACGTTSAVSPRPMARIGTRSSRITASWRRTPSSVFTQDAWSGSCDSSASSPSKPCTKAWCAGCSRSMTSRAWRGSADGAELSRGQVMSTPNGRSVSALIARMRSRSRSGCRGLPPTMPSPPALDTAATSAGGVVEPRLSQPMPAWMIGCSMFRRSQSGVRSLTFALLPPTPRRLADRLRGRDEVACRHLLEDARRLGGHVAHDVGGRAYVALAEQAGDLAAGHAHHTYAVRRFGGDAQLVVQDALERHVQRLQAGLLPGADDVAAVVAAPPSAGGAGVYESPPAARGGPVSGVGVAGCLPAGPGSRGAPQPHRAPP